MTKTFKSNKATCTQWTGVAKLVQPVLTIHQYFDGKTPQKLKLKKQDKYTLDPRRQIHLSNNKKILGQK